VAGRLAVEVRRVGYRYDDEPPVVALEGVDLDVPVGGFVSIVGPSGCGKSTLLRSIAGLSPPTQGDVLVHGEPVGQGSDDVAWMPQRDLLLPWRRALDNAVLGAEIGGRPRREARAEAGRLFPRFGLEGFEKAWPSQLSGGMRQRLALLRTFLLGRDILLLDEPFGALDALTRREMYEWLQDVWLGDRRTVLFVTHDVDEAVYLSDVIYVMSARPGRIVRSITVAEPRPRHPAFVLTPPSVAAKADILAALADSGGER
jgi:ABC-type nitrate/sulfonate/bicarbonate transport system ATPase subunit